MAGFDRKCVKDVSSLCIACSMFHQRFTTDHSCSPVCPIVYSAFWVVRNLSTVAEGWNRNQMFPRSACIKLQLTAE